MFSTERLKCYEKYKPEVDRDISAVLFETVADPDRFADADLSLDQSPSYEHVLCLETHHSGHLTVLSRVLCLRDPFSVGRIRSLGST